MDALSHTINYQPTGVYGQFAQNPMLLCQGASKKEAPKTDTVEQKRAKFNEKAPKYAKMAGIIGLAALAAYKICYYNKGMKAIELKEKTFPNVTEATIDEWMNKPFSQIQREDLLTVWNEGNKHLNGRVGKFHNRVQSVKGWFKEYFFNF